MVLLEPCAGYGKTILEALRSWDRSKIRRNKDTSMEGDEGLINYHMKWDTTCAKCDSSPSHVITSGSDDGINHQIQTHNQRHIQSHTILYGVCLVSNPPHTQEHQQYTYK